MFGRSVFIFIFLIACLVVGTVWIVDRETGANLVPGHYQLSHYRIQSLYLTAKARLQYWWGDVTGKDAGHMTSVRYEATDPKQPAIKKWQDANGTWHFEYEQTAPPASN